MNKTNLLKLKQIRLQLENQLSSILCCKSYIFDSQFNTTDTTDKLHNLDKKIYERPELTTYEPKNTEDILLFAHCESMDIYMGKCLCSLFYNNEILICFE